MKKQLKGHIEMGSILNDLYHEGPKIYSLADLANCDDLLRDRAALIFTPTENIPREFIGEGRLDVTVPLATPTLYDWIGNPAYRVPRLWVDLLQKATGKLRWRPMSPSKVTVVRYDICAYYLSAISTGAKAVIDALIVKAAGRTDGRLLHYFGAIVDDNFKEMTHSEYYEHLVDDPRQVRTRIIVEPAPDADIVKPGSIVFGPDESPPP